MTEVSIKKLAEECGVAVSTVSRAMNNRPGISPSTREKILAKARELGYVPNASARSLKIADSQTIAVIIQGHTSELLIEILSDLQGYLAKSGYDAFLQHVPDAHANVTTVQQIVRERKPAGVIFLGRFGDTGEGSANTVSRQLAGLHIPVVYCTTADFSGPPSRHSSVSIDDVGGAADLTRHLIERGHEKIAFAAVTSAAGLNEGYAWSLRYRGFAAAMDDAGIPINPELVVPSAHPVELYSMANGYESVRRWLEAGPPEFTALVTSCDAIGLGALRALKEAGIRVPEDVAVTAFDGLDFAQYCVPSLTTIVQPKAELAEATAQVMVDAIANPRHSTEQKWIRGKLKLGESTASY